jgi:alkylation response protein AidB-like acyl-CoA dehydrogenase
MEVAAAIDADRHCPPDDAFMAFHAASRAATETSLASLHTHGGFGFALEYDIQLYLRRAMALSLVLGDPDAILRRIGADFLASGQAAP